MGDNLDDVISQSSSGQEPEPRPADSDGDQAAAPVVADGADEPEKASPLPYPVVGIGASAGGVEAYIELFGSLAADTGMAFIVIPHLLADAKSHLVEILGRHTPMPIRQIEDGMRPQPDEVYVLPPNTQARMETGVIRLETRAGARVHHPIDYFFRSLGTEQKTRAVGVVLSGT